MGTLQIHLARRVNLQRPLYSPLKAPEADRRAQEWSVRSLKQTINQLKEEMARVESRANGTAAN